MKSEPRNPAAAKAPGIDLLFLKNNAALSREISFRPSITGRSSFPLSHSENFSYSGSYIGVYKIR